MEIQVNRATVTSDMEAIAFRKRMLMVVLIVPEFRVTVAANVAVVVPQPLVLGMLTGMMDFVFCFCFCLAGHSLIQTGLHQKLRKVLGNVIVVCFLLEMS